MRLSTAITLAITANIPSSTHGHGHLLTPRSRNYASHLAGNESCPHCFNGGTRANVMANTPAPGLWPWPYADPDEMARRGLCGDPAEIDPQPYEPFGEIIPENVYLSEDVIDVKVAIKAHHKGHIEMRLCEVVPWDANPVTCPAAVTPRVTQACLNEYLLLRTSDVGATSGTEEYGADYWNDYGNTASENYGDCSSGARSYSLLGAGTTDWDGWDSCWPERYYLGERRDTPSNPDERGWLADFQVKLPAGLTCKHCLLQMVYVTSNSCTPPGYRADILSMTGQFNMGTCGSDVDLYPEEFWNCADIQIYPSGSGEPFDDCTEKIYGDGSVQTMTTTTVATASTTSGSCINNGSTCSGSCADCCSTCHVNEQGSRKCAACR